MLLISGTTCTVPAPNANVTVLTPLTAETMTQAEYILYECAVGHLLKSGNLERGCQSDGVLTGNPPVCVGKKAVT